MSSYEPSIKTVRKNKQGQPVFVYMGNKHSVDNPESNKENIRARSKSQGDKKSIKSGIKPPAKKKQAKSQVRPLPYPLQTPTVSVLEPDDTANFDLFDGGIKKDQSSPANASLKSVRKYIEQLRMLREIQEDLEYEISRLEEECLDGNELYNSLRLEYEELSRLYEELLETQKLNDKITSEIKEPLVKTKPIIISSVPSSEGEEPETFIFPFTSVNSWKSFTQSLKVAFPSNKSCIDNNKFVLHDSVNGGAVLPHHWKELVEPGLKYQVKFRTRGRLFGRSKSVKK